MARKKGTGGRPLGRPHGNARHDPGHAYKCGADGTDHQAKKSGQWRYERRRRKK
ncbi:MAG: hypothetical protein OXD31_16385 [Chloroflexi bacterium]|nr:hypothetical protein [Chloroflexota bacterium]